MEGENDLMRDELDALREQFAAFKQFAMSRNIALPHDLLATV